MDPKAFWDPQSLFFLSSVGLAKETFIVKCIVTSSDHESFENLESVYLCMLYHIVILVGYIFDIISC